MPTVLIVDDDDRIRYLLKEYLVQNNYSVMPFSIPTDISSEDLGKADVMILDVVMFDQNGFSYLSSLRRENIGIPVILLTAKSDIEDKVHGLEMGADDYLTKPFDPRELLFRIRNVLRRKSQHNIRLGKLELNINRQILRKMDSQEEVLLTSSEFKILDILAENLGKTVAREDIVNSLYAFIGERSIDVQINRLRKKIEPDPKNPKYLKTVRHIGYMLVSDDS